MVSYSLEMPDDQQATRSEPMDVTRTTPPSRKPTFIVCQMLLGWTKYRHHAIYIRDIDTSDTIKLEQHRYSLVYSVKGAESTKM